jgi:hypothetical protein
LVLKPGTGTITGTISKTRNLISMNEKILKQEIRNQKIMKLNPGTGIRNLGDKIKKITKIRNKDFF